MLTMTSLEAQNHFGELIDTSQREPVLITRRGRPVSVVLSPNGDMRGAMVEFLKVVSAVSPLRGKAAWAEIERALAPIDAHNAAREAAGEPQLTEAELAQLLKAA